MATLRTLVTKLRVDAVEAVKTLKIFDRTWKVVAKSVESSAAMVERSADRAVAALQRMGDAAAVARASAGAAAAARTSSAPRGGGGGQRSGGQSSPVIDSIVARGAKVAAAQAGLAQGSKPITAATDALGRFATAQERARAKVADLTVQVARNREEVARLKRQAVETGDAEGLLAARMRGLSVATLDATAKLQGARRELRAFEGGLIDAIKKASIGKVTVQALGTAIGNMASNAIGGAARGIAGGIAGAAKEAMSFEKAIVDVEKVAQDSDLIGSGKDKVINPAIVAGIKEVSKELGVLPTEVAELTAQITAGFSGKTDIVALAKDVTKIGVAWDITGKQAGEFFKQTSAGLQINADETKALFGTINELGNRLGVKSSEVAEAMTRSAGVLKGANVSGETGAALNATLIKAGASAEVAATGVRTFLARLGAGTAATDKQRHAFKELGLSAEAVAKNLASGDAARAEKQIKDVVDALVKMGEKSPEKRLSTLIELFGSESIGSIGAAASATDALAQSFAIAGDKGAALTSVQSEYDRVSKTSAAGVEKLKANIAVLAIELGNALLPHINKVTAFLTSPEGQEWGKGAVEKAVVAVTNFAEVLGTVASALAWVIENVGLTNAGIAVMAIRLAALAGPWGLVGLAATAALAAISRGIGEVLTRVPLIGDVINDTRNRLVKMAAEDQSRLLAEKVRAQGDAAYEDRGAARAGGPTLGTGPAPMASGPPPPGSGGAVDRAAGMARFDELVRMRNASPGGLAPAEAKELRSLSKSLNRAIPHKPGRGHKQTKMDRQLAAIDPSVRAVLTRGGEKDRGGDLMVAGNVLDKSVLAKASAARGLGGVEGVGGVGPGPNITNHYTYITTTVQQAIDARGNGSAADNIGAAGQQVAANAASAINFTGVERLKAARNAGGVRRGPA